MNGSRMRKMKRIAKIMGQRNNLTLTLLSVNQRK